MYLLVNKKNSYYKDDFWTIKYLPKFKWENLTEKLAYDARVRKEKLNMEMKKASKKKEFYLDKMEKSKKIMGIIKKVLI
jgi:ESF2/ABP1 family protein